MSKPLQSQWDFDDVFEEKVEKKVEKEVEKKVYTVGEITRRVKSTLEGHFGQVWIEGEVSNYRLQSSGHRYFSLKDNRSQIQCVLFKGSAGPSAKCLKDGLSLRLFGDLTVYEPRGQYQVIVSKLELEGTGALQLAFERLKQKLLSEGLFDADTKKALPALVLRIGLITSPTGAALRDFIHVVQRRFPGLEIILDPVRVQGEGASTEIARALDRLHRWSDIRVERGLRPLDCIVVTRGGGSLEDLWAFNEEEVARAAHRSKLPVVSAIGHEIDTSILDFVADVRAATPSAAAEILTQGVLSAREMVPESITWMREIVQRRLLRNREKIVGMNRLMMSRHPRRLLRVHMQNLDELNQSRCRSLSRGIRRAQTDFQALVNRLLRVSPRKVVERNQGNLSELRRGLFRSVGHQVSNKRVELGKWKNSLDLLSPRKVMERGYSVTRDAETGEILRGTDRVRSGMKLRTSLASGHIKSTVDSVD